MAESTQWAVLMPLALLMVLGVIHGGLLLAGRGAAAQAALAGAETGAVAGGTGVDQARQAALDVAQQAGLREVQVQVSPGPDVVVTVTGRIDTFWPGPSRVVSRAVAPAEVPR